MIACHADHIGSLWANFWSPQRSRAAYPTLDSFLADVVDILREEVVELARLGAAYIQLDAPHYALLCCSIRRRAASTNRRAGARSATWNVASRWTTRSSGVFPG
jgi:methionine synthase II (cobalamin-independent)